MGSFNVACSISNISIGCGTKVVFIPLLPSEMNDGIIRKYNSVALRPGYVFLEPSSNWVSNEGAFQFYKPFCLPIVAEYNDYGGIENIEENITTKVITEYFGISVEEFIECIGAQRGDYDYFSPLFNSYFERDKKLLSDYSVSFNEKWLIDLGFIKLEDGTFQYKDHSYRVKLFKVKADEKKHRQAGFGYEILKGDKVLQKNSDTYDNRERFLEHYYAVSSYRVGYKEDSQEKLTLLSKMSGMFVHYDIYKFMTSNSFSEYGSRVDSDSWINDAYLSDDTLNRLGFKLRCVDESIERYNRVYEYPGETRYVMHCDGTWAHISKTSDDFPNGSPKQKHYVDFSVYHPGELIRAWKKLTDTDIVYDEIKAKESKFASAFDQIQSQYIAYLHKKEKKANNPEEIEINNKREERLKLLTENSDELKKAIEDIRSDEAKFELFKAIASFRMEDEMDEFDSEDSEEENEVEWTDEMIGAEIIKSLKEPYSPTSIYENPLQNPRGHIYLPLKPSYDNYNMLITLYEPYVVDGSIRQDVVDFCRFYWNCYAMNKMLMPAHNGFQFGCHSATYHLALKTVEIMDKKLKEYEEEEEEMENE